jgi:hypothetical protein
MRFHILFAFLLVSSISICYGSLNPHAAASSFKSHTPKRQRHRLFPKSAANLLQIRAGQSADPNNYPNYDAGIPTDPNNYPNYDAGIPTDYNPPGTPGNDPFQETVQERVENWRSQQQQKYQGLSAAQEANPRDEKGRMKLLASVGKGSRAFIFFVMMWRDIHLYEVADQALKGTFRLMVVVPMVGLFIANLAGAVVSFSSPSHSSKKRLKAILNLDKVLEAIMLFWYFIRLTVAPSRYVPREVFIANTLHSVFFIVQCQAFTRVSWYV